MDLEQFAESEPIKVELKDGEGSVCLIFKKASHRDMYFAAHIVDQTDLLKGAPQMDRDELVTTVFSKLTAIEGEIKKAGEVITVEQLKDMARTGQLTYLFASKILVPWALGVLKALGFLTEALKTQSVQSA